MAQGAYVSAALLKPQMHPVSVGLRLNSAIVRDENTYSFNLSSHQIQTTGQKPRNTRNFTEGCFIFLFSFPCNSVLSVVQLFIPFLFFTVGFRTTPEG